MQGTRGEDCGAVCPRFCISVELILPYNTIHTQENDQHTEVNSATLHTSWPYLFAVMYCCKENEPLCTSKTHTKDYVSHTRISSERGSSVHILTRHSNKLCYMLIFLIPQLCFTSYNLNACAHSVYLDTIQYLSSYLLYIVLLQSSNIFVLYCPEHQP